MHRIFRVKAYEKEHGPHFNEEYARKAVMKMENEDGTRGPHWSLEETTTLASQYGIALGSKFNRYDWFVALNMVYSDYYRVIMNITGSNNTKHYVEFAKAWLNDKDIDEGKMWYYYIYVMCDHIREAEMECYEENMLEDRIIVQDRGIDAGLAALMQNANKGMDPAALMAMMNNNGGFGGNGGWWWIWIILIWFCWGGNGFGGRNAGALASELNTDANTNLLMQAINGNKDAINNLSTTLNCDINAVQTALNQINAGVSQISCDTKLSSCEVINAITSGNANLASQLANCCCDVRSSIADVNNNITKMGYESQLSMCNQTNTLQNAITSGFNSLLSDNTAKFNVLGSKIDAQTQIINDKFCQLEMREMQNKIDALRQENNQLALSASQQAQTANIVSQLKSPCPVPAYFVPNPNCCPFDYYRYLLNRDNTTTAPAA